jgi:hypothetical protein
MPKDYEEMAFTIEQEEWNEYELKDGNTIRGRIILQKINRNPYDPKDFSFKTSVPMWVVYAPVIGRGEPNVKAGEKVFGNKFEVHVVRNHEPWNTYRLVKTGQKLKLKLSITEVSRYVDKFDADGLPIYSVPNGVSIVFSDSDVSKAQ